MCSVEDTTQYTLLKYRNHPTLNQMILLAGAVSKASSTPLATSEDDTIHKSHMGYHGR